MISLTFWSNTPFKRFFRIRGLSLLKCAFFRWLAASFSVKGQTSRKFPHRVAVINRVFSGRIGEIKPDLKQVHPQHFLNAHRRTAAFSLGKIRLDYTDPFNPRNNFIHDFKKFFPSRLLFAATVLNIGKCLLLHFVSLPIFDGFIISYSSPSFITSIKSDVKMDGCEEIRSISFILYSK